MTMGQAGQGDFERVERVDDRPPYFARFQINYKTEYGQIVCMAGSIEELGKGFKDKEKNRRLEGVFKELNEVE